MTKILLSLVFFSSLFVFHGHAAEPSPLQLDQTVVMSDLETPWDLAFTADGVLFFTEKCRGLSVRRTDGSVKRLFGTAGSALVATDFFCAGQTGMHGIALDPDFANNRYLYVYMVARQESIRTNRVVRLTVAADYTSVSDRTDLVKDIPFKDAGNHWGEAGAHSGGRIRFGPDGYLYITTGDNHNGTLPQDLSKLGGKVLRVTSTGQAAPGNNMPEGADPRIFTFGHRNVQGITFHPENGRPFISEHGPGHSDEVTALIPGGNGGWDPQPEVGVVCADNYCGYISNKASGEPTPMTDLEKFPNAMPPVWVQKDSQGMGPCTFVTGPQWKEWSGRLLVSSMAAKSLSVLAVSAEGKLQSETTAKLPQQRMRSLVLGPDGALYVATDEGQIWRVTPR